MITYDQHMSMLLLMSIDRTTPRVKYTDILCCILVVLGVIGNIFGLVIFSSSRHTWRISSVYIYLATSSSIINLCCVIRYALILHSKSRHILSELVGHRWFACKIYEISFAFRVISSWITLFWMLERLTCLSKRLRLLFYRWKTSQMKLIIPLILILFILGCVLGPPVYMYQPQTFYNSTSNTTNHFCGLNPSVSVKWQRYFSDLYLGLNHHTIRCFFSELFPAGAIIIFNSSIMYYLVQTCHRFSQTNENQICQERKRTTSWMTIVLILHSFLFLLSISSHLAGHFMVVEAHETWWVLLSVLANCSLNFYVYCLSGKVFREKISGFIQRIITKISYKLQVRQQQWKQYRHNPTDDDFIYKYNYTVNIEQPETYRSNHYPKTFHVNSSSQEQSSV